MKVLFLLFALLSVASAEPRTGRFVLVLRDSPVAKQYTSRQELRSRAAVDRIRSIADKQRALADTLASKGIQTLGGIQTIANEMVVAATDDQIPALRGLPGVIAVYRDAELKPAMNAAAELMNATAAWTAVGGVDRAGIGVRIAILDTGVDITHPALQDTSLPTPSPAIDCTKGTGVCTASNQKVIVARNYAKLLNYYWDWQGGPLGSVSKNALDPASTRPDDTSGRDRSGHGTAMAAVAAGATVTAPNGAVLRGIAPKAYIGSYQIFGSPGLNEVTYASAVHFALEDALLDNMNVAVLGIAEAAVWQPIETTDVCGSGTAVDGYCDPWIVAVRNAISKGMVVVAPAGNNGNLGTASAIGSITTPGTIPEVITVGATTNKHVVWQTVSIGGSNVPAALQVVNAFFGNGPKPSQALAKQVVDVASTGNDGLACSPLPAGSLSNKIALIQRGTCVRDTKINNAQKAGAAGVIIYQDSGSGDSPFYMEDLQNTGIPAVLIGNSAGTALKTYIQSNPNATATLDPTPRVVDTSDFDIVPSFSSQGPSIDGTLKPELVATGTDLLTATQSLDPSGSLYSASRYTGAEGTSFSAAIVAGAAALVLQTHPTYTPAQVKSAVVNTANTKVYELDSNNNVVVASVNAVGAGKLDALNAVQTNITVEPATASFGALNGSFPARNLRITNTGNASLNVSISVQPIETDTRGQIVVTPQSFSLGAGQFRDVVVTVGGSTPTAGSYTGDIVIQGGNVGVHVPYMYLVGNNTPFNIQPISGVSWIRSTGGTAHLELHLLDRNGVPVSGVPYDFSGIISGATCQVNGRQVTDSVGVACATVEAGSPGEQQSVVTAGGLQYSFLGRSRSRPAVADVVDAARYAAGPFAPGSYISIRNLGNGTLAEATQTVSTTSLPTSMSGVSVSFDVPDQQISVPGHVSYVSPTQINVQIPWELAGLRQAVVKTVLWNGDLGSASDTFTVSLTDTVPGFFPFDPGFAGCVCPAALDPNYGYVTTNNPAKRGQYVQLFMNGLGPVTNLPASGEPSPTGSFSQTKTLPTVTIGGVQERVLFSGLAPGIVGLYQVNVAIAAETPAGVQPLNFSMNGSSTTTNLPIQ